MRKEESVNNKLSEKIDQTKESKKLVCSHPYLKKLFRYY